MPALGFGPFQKGSGKNSTPFRTAPSDELASTFVAYWPRGPEMQIVTSAKTTQSAKTLLVPIIFHSNGLSAFAARKRQYPRKSRKQIYCATLWALLARHVERQFHPIEGTPHIRDRNRFQNKPAFVACDVCRIAALDRKKQPAAFGIAKVGMGKHVFGIFGILWTFHNSDPKLQPWVDLSRKKITGRHARIALGRLSALSSGAREPTRSGGGFAFAAPQVAAIQPVGAGERKNVRIERVFGGDGPVRNVRRMNGTSPACTATSRPCNSNFRASLRICSLS